VHLMRDALPHADPGGVLTDICVIGVGNLYRGDDAAGLAVSGMVADAAVPGVRVCEHDGEPAGLLDLWADADRAYVADMVRSGAEPGTVHWVDVTEHDLPFGASSHSSHHLSISEAVALARVLGRLPARLVLVGVEGASSAAGVGLTPKVADGVSDAAGRILADVRAVPGPA
jgi:hydrogenase maturation protease